MSAEKTQKYRLRHAHLLQQRNTGWDDEYKEIADYILPKRGYFCGSQPNQRAANNGKIVNGIAGRSLRTLAAGLQGGLTSPSRPWFRLSLEDQYWADHPMVKLWLAEVERRLRYALSRSNFYLATHSMYTELGGFGTGCIFIDRGGNKPLHFFPQTIGSYCFATDAYGRVDTMYRTLQLTAKVIVEMFGEGSVSAHVRKLSEKNPYTYVEVVHAVQPNKSRKPGKVDNQNMPWESVYYENEYDLKLLRKSGYKKFPVAGPRWEVTGSNVYGDGPGSETLLDVKMLQAESKTILKAIQKAVDPALKAPPELRGRVNMLPGSVNYTDGTLEEIVKTRPDIQAAISAREETKQAIREGFFNDLFLMLTQPTRDVTATEIMERKEEKMLMLGPVVERQGTEFADIVIEQSLDNLMADPGFPMLPDDIMAEIGDYKIEYVSVLAQAQKMVGIQAIQKTASFAGNLAQGFPSVLDKVDADAMLDEYHDMVGSPVRVIRTTEQVDEIRAERAAKEQQQAQLQEAAMTQSMQGEAIQQQKIALEGARAGSQALKGASETDLDSLLSKLSGAA